MKKILFILLVLITPITVFGQASTLNRLDQWVSTTSPTTAVTQRVMNIPIRITGLTSTLPLCVDVNGIVTTSGCIGGSGGGSAGGTWSTTTSSVSGRLNNYSNNTTDIVNIGGTATTSSDYWFDPNTLVSYLAGNVGVGTTSPYAKLSVTGQVVGQYFTATSTTATSTIAGAFSAGGSSGFAIHSNGIAALRTNSQPYTSLRIGNADVGDESSAIEILRSVSQTANNSSFHFGLDSGLHWNLAGFNQTGDLRAVYGGIAPGDDVGGGTFTRLSSFYAYLTGDTGEDYDITDAYGMYIAQNNPGIGTIANLYGVRQIPVGTNNGTIQNIVGFDVDDNTGTVSTKAFSGGVLSGTGKYNLYLDGTAQNYLQGNVGIGTTTPSTKFQVYSTPTRYVHFFDVQSTQSNIFRIDDNSATNLITLENRDITATTDHGIDIDYRFANNISTSPVSAGTIRVAKEQQWTSTASTQDSYISLSPALNGTVTEQVRVTSGGSVGIGSTTPGTLLSLGDTGANTINISPTATSTFGSGINLRTGCFAVNGVCISGGGGGGSATPTITTTLPFNDCEAQTNSYDFAPGGAYMQPIYGSTFTNATSSAITCNLTIPDNVSATPNGVIMPYLTATTSGNSVFEVNATTTSIGQNWIPTSYTNLLASTSAASRFAITGGSNYPLNSTTTISTNALNIVAGSILKVRFINYHADANDTVENDLFMPKAVFKFDIKVN